MPYDFETVVDRSHTGSIKWDFMREVDPDMPPGIVPFSVADMELKNPPEIVEGLKQYLDTHILGYTRPTDAYRHAVVDWFERRHDWRIDPEWIVDFDGVVPALYLAVVAFTEPGDGVIYMPPVYRPMYHAVNDTGRRPVAVPLLLGRDGYAMDFELLDKAAADPRVKALLLCSPHNPVARIWRPSELEQMGRICRKHGVLVVSDEIHMDFAMPGHRHPIYTEVAPGFAEHGIVCTAPSKTFNLAGLQTSNIVIPDKRLRERFVQAKGNGGRHSVNQLGLAACRIAYERCADWLDQLLALVHANGEMVRAFMAEHFPEVAVFPHEGTYCMWLDFRAWGLDEERLEQFMAKKARLFLDEGYIFGEEGRGFERINLACPAWVLREALERLRAVGRPA